MGSKIHATIVGLFYKVRFKHQISRQSEAHNQTVLVYVMMRPLKKESSFCDSNPCRTGLHLGNKFMTSPRITSKKPRDIVRAQTASSVFIEMTDYTKYSESMNAC